MMQVKANAQDIRDSVDRPNEKKQIQATHDNSVYFEFETDAQRVITIQDYRKVRDKYIRLFKPI
jgi:hypothetical protein